MLVMELMEAKFRITQAQRKYLGALARLGRNSVRWEDPRDDAICDALASATDAQLDKIATLPWLTGIRSTSSRRPGLISQCIATTSGAAILSNWNAVVVERPDIHEALTDLALAGARILIATRVIALNCLTTASILTRTPTDDLLPLLDDAVDEASIVMALRIDPTLLAGRKASIVIALTNTLNTNAPISIASTGHLKAKISTRRVVA